MSNDINEIDPSVIKRLKHLEEIYVDVKTKYDNVQAKVSTLQMNERKLSAELLKGKEEHEKLTTRLTDHKLNCENGVKKLHQRQNEINEFLVEHSLLQMRLHQMQNLFEKEIEKFYDLENHQLQMQLAVDERMIDLRCQTDLLETRKKHLQNERSILKADIAERSAKISTLKSRYELANELMGRNEDGSLITAIQLKIRTAQEREMLMKQGSELNRKVIAAERDIKSLEQTLMMLNYANDRYKKSVQETHVDGEFLAFEKKNIFKIFFVHFQRKLKKKWNRSTMNWTKQTKSWKIPKQVSQ